LNPNLFNGLSYYLLTQQRAATAPRHGNNEEAGEGEGGVPKGDVGIPRAAAGDGEPGVLANPIALLEEFMKKFLEEELVKDEDKVRIVPLWHAIRV